MHETLEFAGHALVPLPCGGLYWPQLRALLVADMHLEKGSFFASHGQLLPPYDSVQTLADITRALEQHAVDHVYCLGDSFHDAGAFARLHPETRLDLRRLTRSVEWIWITGNHDPDIAGDLGGASRRDCTLAGVMLRHEADTTELLPEISGHFHPKVRLRVRGRMIARRCFAVAPAKIIMPSYGAYTGGLDVADPVVRAAMVQPFAAIIASDTGLRHFAVS